jgi:two-component system LytT family response regulator
VFIVDDERVARKALRECCAAEPDLEVIGEFSRAADALEEICRDPPHLIFLDIEMATMSGMELARALDSAASPLIVFVTAHDHYAREAFEVSAVDYLLKPFDERRFRTMLSRVRQRYDANTAAERRAAMDVLLEQVQRAAHKAGESRPRLLADAGGRMQVIDVARVELLEAERNYVRLRVGKESFHARTTLRHAEEAMSSQPMLRISRSCVVNMNHVREVGRTPRGDFVLVLSGGTTVSSSQGHRDKVRTHLEQLMI